MTQLPDALQNAINDQITKEFESAHLYLAMSAAAADHNFSGAAHWLRLQWQEEIGHAIRMVDYAIERDSKLVLQGLSKPRFTFDSLRETFAAVLAHEREISASINDLYALAAKHNDYAAQIFLQWYVNEQIEEENSAEEILKMLELAGDHGPALLMVDQQLAKRAGGEESAGV